MYRHSPQEGIYPDEETLQAWENMRLEVLHELQDGASADIPDASLEVFGTLVATLASSEAQMEQHQPEAEERPNCALTKSIN